MFSFQASASCTTLFTDSPYFTLWKPIRRWIYDALPRFKDRMFLILRSSLTKRRVRPARIAVHRIKPLLHYDTQSSSRKTLRKAGQNTLLSLCRWHVNTETLAGCGWIIVFPPEIQLHIQANAALCVCLFLPQVCHTKERWMRGTGRTRLHSHRPALSPPASWNAGSHRP